MIPPCALRKRIVPVEIGSVAADGLQPRGTLGDALESSVGDMTELTDVSEPSPPSKNRRTTEGALASRLVLFLKPSTVKPRLVKGLPASAQRSITTPDAFS